MIEVRLPTEDWNKVLAILAQAPWAQANPLIMAIANQMQAAQSTVAAPREGAMSMERPNGADPNP